jgi:hypothetical protein
MVALERLPLGGLVDAGSGLGHALGSSVGAGYQGIAWVQATHGTAEAARPATVTGFILQGRSDLADRIVDSAAAQFPIIGTSIQKTVQGSRLRGSGPALVVGAAFALWGGLGVADAPSRR